MSDIVERLRHRGKANPPFSYANDDDLLLAADEIERLRELLREVRGLFALADEWCQRVDTQAEYPRDLLNRIDAAIRALKDRP